MNEITSITTAGSDSETNLAPVPTFDGKAYAISVFEPFKRQITKAKREAAKTETYDITTGAGMGRAKELRAMFRDIRTTVENVRKDRKAPIIQAGKLLDERAAEIKAEVEPFEDRYDREIKAEEQRKADEKARKEAEERARVEAIQNRVDHIRGAASRLAGATSDAIKAELNTWTLMRLEPADYQEYLEDALTAVNTTIDQLTALLAQAEAREAEARRVQEERAELARLKAEQEEREKAEREAAAERDRLARAEAQRVEAERRAAADREAELQRQLADMKAQLAAASAPAAPTVAPIEEDHTGIIVGAALVSAGQPGPDAEIVEKLDPAVHVLVEDAKLVPGAVIYSPRPTHGEMVEVLAKHYEVSEDTIINWLKGMDL
jgi:hypothetical protein